MTSPSPLHNAPDRPRPPPPPPPPPPCEHCRSKHRKCNYDSTCDTRCQRCRRDGRRCVRGPRGSRAIRFRPASPGRSHEKFPPGQIWVKVGRKGVKLRFIDETAEIVAGYCSDESDTASNVGAPVEKVTLPVNPHSSQIGSGIDPYPDVRDGNSAVGTALLTEDHHSNIQDQGRAGSEDTELPDPDFFFKSRPSEDGDEDGRLKAVLLRYFADAIGPRFDGCDPKRHFTRVVPQRARSSPYLLNAILTSSARHLARLHRHRNTSGVIEWQGQVLPNMTDESAVRYHNKCIKDLLRLSMDPDQIQDEDLLAAAIILRTDEEMDAPFGEDAEDHEIFLGMVNMFISAQVPSVAARPQRSPEIHDSTEPSARTLHWAPEVSFPSTSSPESPIQNGASPHTYAHSLEAGGFRAAAFWVALRQEILTSFMKQRPLNFPLTRCEAFRNLSPTEDFMWANRLIIFCADVLEYCYGSCRLPTQHDPSHWHDLKRYERELIVALPTSFEPIYYRPSDNQSGELFPGIWLLDACHVTGITHMELARILLAVYNPTRPKLGRGYAASQSHLTEEVKERVRHVIGIALCNRQSPAAFMEALMVIAMCGEYFIDHREQVALLGILKTMTDELAFPTGKVEVMLKQAWAW